MQRLRQVRGSKRRGSDQKSASVSRHRLEYELAVLRILHTGIHCEVLVCVRDHAARYPDLHLILDPLTRRQHQILERLRELLRLLERGRAHHLDQLRDHLLGSVDARELDIDHECLRHHCRKVKEDHEKSRRAIRSFPAPDSDLGDDSTILPSPKSRRNHLTKDELACLHTRL